MFDLSFLPLTHVCVLCKILKYVCYNDNHKIKLCKLYECKSEPYVYVCVWKKLSQVSHCGSFAPEYGFGLSRVNLFNLTTNYSKSLQGIQIHSTGHKRQFQAL